MTSVALEKGVGEPRAIDSLGCRVVTAQNDTESAILPFTAELRKSAKQKSRQRMQWKETHYRMGSSIKRCCCCAASSERSNATSEAAHKRNSEKIRQSCRGYQNTRVASCPGVTKFQSSKDRMARNLPKSSSRLERKFWRNTSQQNP